MRAIHVDDLRHLSAALAFKGRSGLGSCVQRSVALALDLPQAVVVFGTLRAASDEEIERGEAPHNASRVPFIHCWLELGPAVLAPTTIERAGGLVVPMSRESYYELNDVRDARPVPRDAFDRIARRHRLSAALKHLSQRFGNHSVTEELLNAAGVKYVLGPDRALLPATTTTKENS